MGGGAYGAVGEVSDVAERLCFSALGPPQVALLLRHEIVRHPLSPHTHTHNLQPHEMPSDGALQATVAKAKELEKRSWGQQKKAEGESSRPLWKESSPLRAVLPFSTRCVRLQVAVNNGGGLRGSPV